MDSKDPVPAPSQSEPETPISKPEDDTAIWSLRHIQILWSWAARPKPTLPKYPPISTIPRTGAARLSEPDVSPTPFPSEPVLSKNFHQDAPTKPNTILYLAYGSNMCAETFLGMRGIRPLSQVNVSAPALDLTFDLPGIPYREPCFANTALRKVPGKKPPFDPPKFPPGMPGQPPAESPTAQQNDEGTEDRQPRRGAVWNKGVYGIVYEITTEDWAKIMSTEGAGASYHDILVPCFILPPSIRVPEKPTIPVPPMPFLAHTLYAPRLPSNNPGDDDDDHPSSSDPNPAPPKPTTPNLPRWLTPLLHPVQRPSPAYAQPSARYLKLLRDGAREHELPADYQAYLGALQPYTITTTRQKWGQVLFLGVWAPAVILMMMAGRWFADERGRAPPWVVAFSTVVFNLVWGSYDCVGKRCFGDGERTVGGDGGEEEERKGLVGRVRLVGEGRGRRSSFASGLRGKEEVADEEKRALLDGYP